MGVLADVLYLINIPRLLTPRRRAPIKNYIFMSVAFVTTLFFTLIYFTQMYFEDIILLMVVVLLFLFVFYGIAQSRADLEDDYIDREIITMERKVAGNETKIVDLKRRQEDAKTVAEKRKLEREIIKLEQENSRTELDEKRVFNPELVDEVRRDLRDKDELDLKELEKREKEYQRELRELTADEGAIKDVMKTNRISSLMSKQKNIQDIRDRKLGYADKKNEKITRELANVKTTEDALAEQRTELETALNTKRAELSRAVPGNKAALKAEIGKIEEALQVNKETMDTTERKRAVLREGRLDNLAGIEAYNGGANIVRAEAVANDGLMRLIEQKRLKKKSTQADRDVLLRAQNLTDERNAQQEALNGALALADTGKEDKWKKLRDSSYNRMATGKETRKLDELKRQENLYERAYEAAATSARKTAAKNRLIDNNREIVEVRNNLIRLNKETEGDKFATQTTFDNAEAYYGTSAGDRQKLDEDIARLRDRVSKESGTAVKEAIDEVTDYNKDKKGVSDFLGNTRRRNYMLNRHELDTQSAIPSTHSEATVNLGLEARKIYGGKQQAGELAEEGAKYVGRKLGDLFDFLGDILTKDRGVLKYLKNKVDEYKERQAEAERKAAEAEAERKAAEAEVQRRISEILRARSREITAGIRAEIRRLEEEKRQAERKAAEAAEAKKTAIAEAEATKNEERRITDALKEVAKDAKERIASAKGVVTEGTRNFLQGTLRLLRDTTESVSQRLEARRLEARRREAERKRRREAEEQTSGLELTDLAGVEDEVEEPVEDEVEEQIVSKKQAGERIARRLRELEYEEPVEEEDELSTGSIPPPPPRDAPGFDEAPEYVTIPQRQPRPSPLRDPDSPTQREIKARREERARRKREVEEEAKLEKAREREQREIGIKSQREARKSQIGGLDDTNFSVKGYENIGGSPRPDTKEDTEDRERQAATREAEVKKQRETDRLFRERYNDNLGPYEINPYSLTAFKDRTGMSSPIKKKKRKSPLKKKKKSPLKKKKKKSKKQ